MYFSNMLHNCKPKAGSACFAGSAFVCSIEALEDPFPLTPRYADPAVQHGEKGTAVLQPGPHNNKTVFTVVLDSILDQVLKEFLHKITV